MKKSNRIATSVVAVIILLLSFGAKAKMDITRVDAAGFPLPPGSQAEACLGNTLVVVSGELQVMSQTTVGGIHFTHQEQFINLLLVDTATGTYYKAAGTTGRTPPISNTTQLPSGGSFIDRVTITNVVVPIADPDGLHFMIHVNYQMTLNANGELKVSILEIRSDCM